MLQVGRKKKKEKKHEKELEKLVSKTGLKGAAREGAQQYGRGMLEGMRLAYLAVTERLLRAGNSKEEISAFFAGLLEEDEIESLLQEAEGSKPA